MLVANPFWGQALGISIGAGTVVAISGSGTTLYDLNTNVSTNGPVIRTTLSPSAVGNTSVGIFGAGATGGSTAVNTTNKLTYAGLTVAAGTSLTTNPAGNMAAAGTATLGVFSGGVNGSTYYQGTSKYTYAGDTTVAGTNLNGVRANHCGCGPISFALFTGNGNFNDNTSVTYVYSNDSVAAGTFIGYDHANAGAAGNSTYGIFGGGGASGAMSSRTDQYVWAGATVTPSTALTYAENQMGAAGNQTGALFLGGSLTTNFKKTSLFVFGTSATAGGAALSTGMSSPGVACSNPGWS